MSEYHLEETNRKISKFAKAQLLRYGVVKALKLGFDAYLVNPAYTFKFAVKIQKSLGLDVHTTSAYVLALKFLDINLSKAAKVSKALKAS